MAESSNAAAETVAVAVIEDKREEKQEHGNAKSKQHMAIPLKNLILPLTLISFLLSLPILFSVIWLLYIQQQDCEDLLRLPKLQIGIVTGLILVFLSSNLVVYFRAKFPVPGFLVVMVPLVLMLTVGLGLIGAYMQYSRTIPGSPVWLKKKVADDKNWDRIKSCIYTARRCDDLFSRTYMLKEYDFSKSRFSYIESGCCRPPLNCEMEYVNATFWKRQDVVDRQLMPDNTDCDLWKNKENVLCYNCQACKEGFLKTLLGKWGKLGTFLVVMALLLIISHLLLFVATMSEQYAG
ncbi:tetraspanin-15 [Diospyros lotus]|uniref:tetraspanin-15 n=1 Tax=Diospyros lotus TaxID=55363 RepID=UPI00225AE07B|nr:tetraspanin-15 [Diospyros lotus]